LRTWTPRDEASSRTAGVRSAVAAGFPCVGNLLFVPDDEREEREAALLDAGAAAIVSSWWQLDELLSGAAVG